ncbi:MAG: carbon-nitrogen hydrolase family protein [Anaerolineae bacterium]
MMKAALIVPRVRADAVKNTDTLLRLADQAAGEGADMLLFPEASLTGLVNNDDPTHDLPLGQPIPGPSTGIFSRFCRERRVWLGLGLLEREDGVLYDSAILLDAQGNISLRYRRIQPQWHGRHADPTIYCQGCEMAKTVIPFGSVSFLICGDLFDDAIVARFRQLQPDLLLFPFARSLPGGVLDQSRWDNEELPLYRERVRLAGIPALMVNYLADPSLVDDNSFGGAFVISAQGELLASLPLGEQGMLLVDLSKGGATVSGSSIALLGGIGR